MKFTELENCPFCGSEEFYSKNYMYGTSHYNERFDGEETYNDQMYDGLIVKYGYRAYCCNCNRYLGNKTKNTLSKNTELKLKELKNER